MRVEEVVDRERDVALVDAQPTARKGRARARVRAWRGKVGGRHHLCIGRRVGERGGEGRRQVARGKRAEMGDGAIELPVDYRCPRRPAVGRHK
jgi:hypothetical protein